VKGAIIVDGDIDADDLPRVWWALSTRYNPKRDTQIMNRVRAAPLDPSFGPDENKDMGSRIILDATIPFERQEKPTEVTLTQHVVDRVKARWKELGLE
jgi:3-polyprenyl-4-hydroxybenzoate decarboxylase